MHPSHLHYLPLSFPFYAIFGAILFALFILLQLGLLRYAYIRIGLDPRTAMLVLLASLLGSYVNIPVAQLPEERRISNEVLDFFGMPYSFPVVVDWPGTILAVNVGGAVIPCVLSIYLLARNRIWGAGALATIIVAVIVHLFARIVPGAGISVPIPVPPLTAFAAAMLLSRRSAPPLAYVGGSLGTLAGADLANLDKISGIGTPIVSIGGAGTFDGIFLAGVLAVLLAALLPRPAEMAKIENEAES